MPVKQNKRKAKSIIGELPPKQPAIIKEVKFKEPEPILPAISPIVEEQLVEDMKNMEIQQQEKIKKSRPKTVCSCGMEISNSGMKRHLEGKKHKEAIAE